MHEIVKKYTGLNLMVLPKLKIKPNFKNEINDISTNLFNLPELDNEEPVTKNVWPLFLISSKQFS